MMKKILLSFVCFGMMSGCAADPASFQSKTEYENIWHLYPSIPAAGLQNMVEFAYETVQQDDSKVLICGNRSTELNAAEGDYTDDAIMIKQEDMQEIYNFDGELLYTLPMAVSETLDQEGIVAGYALKSTETHYMEFAFGYKRADEKAVFLSDDFKTSTEIPASSFIYHPYDGDQIYDSLAIQDGTFKVISDEGEIKELTEALSFDMVIATQIDGNGKEKGLAVCSSDGDVISSVPNTLYQKQSGFFVNGFYPVKDENGSVAMVNAKTGKEITDYVYKDAGYFSDGYCPVEDQEGKWGYINTSGESVSAFLFDQASSLHDQKAWVIKDGQAGILNMSSVENMDDSIFRDTQSDIVISQDTASKEAIGKVTIKAEMINIRKGPSTDYDTDGTVTIGNTYPVYEIKEDNDYTWYRISEEKWIAGNTEWLDYSQE